MQIKNNRPAAYSVDNVPYVLKKLPISIDGIKENDFTMVLGFPGRTTEYLPSYAVSNCKRFKPAKIEVRDAALKVQDGFMEKIAIKFNIQNISPITGKWIGETKGLKKSIECRWSETKFESDFKKNKVTKAGNKWNNGNLLSDFEKIMLK
jgi:hypothetical protein